MIVEAILKKVRRVIIRLFAGFCALHAQPLFAASADIAAAYPEKPIRFIVPFAPGGNTDTISRLIAKQLSDMWGQPIVPDNRPGAAGVIALTATAQANPDGYTLCLISSSQSVNSAINRNLPYDLEKDLQATSRIATTFYVLSVNGSLPARSVKELISYAKANPAKLNFGSSGTGGLQHLAGEMFNRLAGIKLIHVPYKGGAAVLPAMAGGEIQLGFTALVNVKPFVMTGRVRMLAVTTNHRVSVLPELPTVAEAGVPGFEIEQWYGVVTGAKVSRAIVQKVSAGIADALSEPEVIKALSMDGAVPVGSSSEQFAAYLKSDLAKWRKVVKQAGLVLN